MSPVVAPDNTTACECGARWILKVPYPAGVTRMMCTSSHAKDFSEEVTPRTNAVELVGGRDGYDEVLPEPRMPVGLRVRLWWWRRTRRGGE